MATNSLSPAFFKVRYQSQYAEHVMTLPTRDWIDPEDITDNGSFTAWDTTNVLATDMIEDFITLVAENFSADVTFIAAELYTQADENSTPVFRRLIPLNITGTSAIANQEKAVQHTYSIKDTSGNNMRLVLLDAVLPVDWEKDYLTSQLNADQLAMLNGLGADTAAFSTRGGGQPVLFMQAAYKLNDKLRRSYGMN
jgi:hypothetical protein